MDSILLKPEKAAECPNIGRSKVHELMAAGAFGSVRLGTCRHDRHDALQRSGLSFNVTAAS